MKRLLLLILALLLLITGCGSPSPLAPGSEALPVITLWHYYQGKAAKGLEQAVKNLNDSNPPYRLQLEYVPKAEYYTMISQAQAADKGPDLLLINQSQIPELFTSGVIQPVDNTFDYNSYFKAAIQAVTFSGNVLAIPKSIRVPLLAYNQKLVPTPPAKLEDVVKAAGGKTNPAGLSGDLSNLFLSGAWYAAFGGQFYNQNVQPTLNAPQVLNFLQGIISLKGIKAGLYDQATSRSMMATGAVPFGLMDSSEIAQYKGMGTIAFSALPGPGGNNGTNYVRVDGFAVAANTAYVKQAAAAAAYLTSPAALTLYSIPQGEFPANPAAYGLKPLQSDPQAGLIKNIAAAGTGYPLDSRTVLLMPILSQMIKDVLNGTDPNQAMQTGQLKADKAFGITPP